MKDSVDSVSKAIIKTLKYRSIFEFPISLEELHEFLISDGLSSPVDKDLFTQSVSSLVDKKGIGHYNGYFYLDPNFNENLIIRREKHETYSRAKYREAEKLLKIFEKFNMIRFIGVTGSVAAANAHEKDDIDLFIITSKNTVWINRFLMFSYLKLRFKLGRFCPNIFIDEENLKWPDQNIYIAHDILLMKPLLNKDKTYEKFIHNNIWIFNYFINYPLQKISMDFRVDNNSSQGNGFFMKMTKITNKILMKMQLMYMKRGQILGKFNENYIQFLKKDHQEKILDAMKREDAF